VHEGTEWLTPECVTDILNRVLNPRQWVTSGKAEDQHALCVFGSDAQKPHIVGVAAHHPVQENGISWSDRLRVDNHVANAATHAILQHRLSEQLCRFFLVCTRHLDVHRLSGPTSEQLHVEPTNTTTDLQDARSIDSLADDELGHLRRRLV
jgi:hypothetical protein